MRYFVLVFALSLSAAQADENRPVGIQTVEWFIAHPSYMRGVLRFCRDNPGEFRNKPNCVNADTAEFKASARRWSQYFPRNGG